MGNLQPESPVSIPFARDGVCDTPGYNRTTPPDARAFGRAAQDQGPPGGSGGLIPRLRPMPETRISTASASNGIVQGFSVPFPSGYR